MGNDISFYWKLSCSVSLEHSTIYSSICFVTSMTLGVLLVILSFLHRLVMLQVPMDSLLMPHVLKSCPIFHVESMFPMSLHLHYALFRMNF